MIRSILVGAAAGARSLTPLALVSEAARRGALPAAPKWLSRPAVAHAIRLAAAGELWGDKLHMAPDRIILPSLGARTLTAGLAGAAVAPRGRSAVGAVLGAVTAIGASYLTFHARKRAMARFGQRWTGLVEDALTAGLAYLVVFRGRGRP
jgi:uncharacterized membrane protein